MIGILDYGAGNLRSVENTLARIGAEYELVRDSKHLSRAEKIIVPGVGHFGQMMRSLEPLRGVLIDRIRAGVPFLGICLGLQALFTDSEEAPEERGLGVFDGTVRRFTGNVRVPHMGWNRIEPRRASRLVEGSPWMYFAHSFYAPLTAATANSCTYGVEYTAVLEHGNIFGVQFHPEKSGDAGIAMVRRFCDL